MADPQTDPQEEAAALIVNGKRIQLIPVDELELDQIEQIEEAFDEPIEDIDFRRVKALRYLIFFSMRRTDPNVSLADLGSVKVSEIDAEDQPDQTANGKAKAKGRPTKAKGD